MSTLYLIPTLANASDIARDLAVILGLAAAVATIFRALRLETIPGFLIAGVIASPNLTGLVKNADSVDQISDLAVTLLMFGIGLHMDLTSLKRGFTNIVLAGVASCALSTLVFWAILLAIGIKAPNALALAMALALSSTAVFVRIVAARKEIRTMHARVGLGINIVQDLYSVVILAIVPPIATWAGAEAHAALAQSTAEVSPVFDLLRRGLIALGGGAIIILVGRFILPRLLALVTKLGSGELLLVVSGAIALGAGLATQAVGLSAEMGAFLAGFLLAATPFRYQLSGQIAPLRDLLMAVFFTTVGLAIDPAVFVTHWWIIVLGVLAVVAIKTLSIGASAWAAGMHAPAALLTAVYLANTGEFSLIALGAFEDANVLTNTQAGVGIAIVILSLIISPLLAAPAHVQGRRLSRIRSAPWTTGSTLADHTPEPHQTPSDHDDSQPKPRHIIVAGFGPVGRALAERLERLKIPLTVIELNPKTVQRQTHIGRRTIYGDVTNPEVLESAGVHHADAIIITIPDQEVAMRACQVVRSIAPHIFIAVRTGFLSQAMHARQLGADHVIVEELATAQAMENEVLAKLRERSIAPDAAV
ncbi:MAG: cation:proton antiporter [Phycisphaerales bacterium]